jgi:hypothetical protein
MRRRWLRVVTVPLALSVAVDAYGDDKGTLKPTSRLDLSVPDIPAFTALGVSPSTISRPDNIKDLVSALSTGVSPTGAIQSGLALEVSPEELAITAAGSPLSSPTVDVLGPLRISGATNTVAPSASNQNSAQTFVAAAFRYGYTMYNPRSDTQLFHCLGPALQEQLRRLTQGAAATPSAPSNPLAVSVAPAGLAESPPAAPPAAPLPPGQPAPERAPVIPRGPGGAPPEVMAATPTLVANEAIKTCKTVARAANLASPFAIEAAYAHSEVAINSAQLDQLHPYADSGWLSVSASYDSLRSAYQHSTNIADLAKDAARAWAFAPIGFVKIDGTRISPATSAERDVNVFVAGRLPVIHDGWSAFVELGHRFIDVTKNLPAPQRKDMTPAGIGFEVRLADGTWLALYASADLQSGTILSLGNLKWSLGENAPF